MNDRRFDVYLLQSDLSYASSCLTITSNMKLISVFFFFFENNEIGNVKTEIEVNKYS